MLHFCTYFDKNYLSRGLALYDSLTQHSNPFVLYVLCMDQFTYNYLLNTNYVHIRAISLSDVEKEDPELRAAKNNRNLIEYYFTCTPVLPIYILKHFYNINIITYLDADLYFYSDLTPIFNELNSNSVLIIEHRFPENELNLNKKHGTFNVGVISFLSQSSPIS